MLSHRNRKLVSRYGGQVMPFRKLPRSAKLSLIEYMAIDGEAWHLPLWTEGWTVTMLRKNLARTIPGIEALYGGFAFGYALIPTGALTEEVMKDDELRGFMDFERYHAWYRRSGKLERHSTRNRWPVILGSFNDETLQDGWHRLHDYYRQGAAVVPVVWFH